MSDDKSAAIVIDLTKDFVGLIRQNEPNWKKGYFRFHMDEFGYGCNASYEAPSGVVLISTFKYKRLLEDMNEKSKNLLNALKKDKAVFILTVDFNLKYNISFDYENLDRWKITKLNGGTGVPEGIAE